MIIAIIVIILWGLVFLGGVVYANKENYKGLIK